MASYVLIGGGDTRLSETKLIDEKIVELSGVSKPKILFIPTASNESPEYISSIKAAYSNITSCDFDWLSLSVQNIEQEINKIDEADIVYVGGGNTKMMIDKWKKHGVIERINKNANRNIVFSGLSAGSICWFEYGISDSTSFENNNDWNYSIVECLGHISGYHCPHYDERLQESNFNNFINDFDNDIIAIENNCAIVIGEKIEIVKSNEKKNAYIINGRKKKRTILDNILANDIFGGKS